MIDTKKVEQRCVEIVDVYRVFGDVVTELVGLPVDHAASDAATHHPDGEKGTRGISAPSASLR